MAHFGTSRIMKNHQTFYRRGGKRIIDLLLSVIALLLLWPLFLAIAFMIRLGSEGLALFKQKRVGKEGSVFLMYKFRTMVKNAEELKKDYLHFNEADGPVFKIKEDPRFTSVGKFLARTGLDELPQLINVLKGEMSLIGPRPLPVDEARQIVPSIKSIRETILPGVTSPWVISGAHALSFKQWMRFDLEYVKTVSFSRDFAILLKTIRMVIGAVSALSSNENQTISL